MYLQNGWKKFVVESGLKTGDVVMLNFFEVGDRIYEITFDVID